MPAAGAPPGGRQERGRVVRWFWFGLGWLAVGVGTLGIVVPGLPTTVFFIVAAACFSRSSPRFEQWVLTRPGIGPMVRDYRAGLGMPRSAKAAATISTAVVCGLSAVLIGTWWVRAIVVAAGAIGVAWILWRVPTRPPSTASWSIRAQPWPVRLFVPAAFAEAVSWVGLLVGMYLKYVADAGERGVEIFGRIHGVVVLAYVAATLLVARHQRWAARTVILGLLASVPPLATLMFESWARRTGRLGGRSLSHPGANMSG